MRTYGRLLALGAVCVGAFGLAAVPASAVTISLGGQNPTVPVTLPLPVSISAGIAPTGVNADVQAPSTDISVNADPSGVHAKATVAGHPLADVDAHPPAVVPVPTPVIGSDPIASVPVVNVPSVGNTAGAPSSSPADSTGSGTPSAHAVGAPRAAGNPSVAERDLSGATPAGQRTPEVTAEIASSPNSGFLHALPGGGARILLWIALAGAVIALRFFVGSATSKATRAG